MYNYIYCKNCGEKCVGFFKKAFLAPEKKFFCQHCRAPHMTSWVGWIVIAAIPFLMTFSMAFLLFFWNEFPGIKLMLFVSLLGLLFGSIVGLIFNYYSPITQK